MERFSKRLLTLATALLLGVLFGLPAAADEGNGEPLAPDEAATASVAEVAANSAEPLWLAKPTNQCDRGTERSRSYTWEYLDELIAGNPIPDCNAWCEDRCTADNGRVLRSFNNVRNFTCECTCCVPK